MSYFKIAACTIVLLAGLPGSPATAGHSGGASASSPGHEMQNGATVTGNGASGYSPGHEMHLNATTPTTTSRGASSYTPGDTISHAKK